MTNTTNETPHAESQSLIPSISIEALLAARDNAQRIYRETAEQLAEAQVQLSRFEVSLPPVLVQFPGPQYLSLGIGSNFEAINREIDRFVWLELFRLTNIDTIMDHKTRGELFDKLNQSQRSYGTPARKKDEEELPELTAENVEAVFTNLRNNQFEYFERCVESVYKALSWEHKTNEPGILRQKLITYGAFYPWSRSMQGDETYLSSNDHLHDLERALCILNGDAPPTNSSPGIRTLGKVPYGKWVEVPNPNGASPPDRKTLESCTPDERVELIAAHERGKETLLSIICYRKGTAHVKIHKKEHVDEMNRIMARRYPGAIPEQKGTRRSQGAQEQAQRPRTSTSLAKTDKQARQAFYTPTLLADEMAAAAFNGTDYYGNPRGYGHTVLEPSAGEGSLARAALRADCLHLVTIENDPHGAEMLTCLAERVNTSKHEGPKMTVDQRDFFDVKPSSYPDGFSVVMMNPPFSNAQEVEHVLHAWEFVKPGGRLVAIMSNAVQWRMNGRYKVFADFLEKRGAEIRKNPSASFKESGTNVETVMVVIDKPKT